MKKISMLVSVLLAFFILFALSASAEDLAFGDYTYTVLEDETVKITGYTGEGGDIVIPSEIDGRAVTVIGYRAFAENLTVKTLVLPDSVTEVGERAFAWCENLLEVSFGNSLTTIGDTAFAYTSIFSAELPDGVTEIDDFAFAYCESLHYFDPGESVKRVGRMAFAGSSVIRGGIHFNDELEYIGEEAFNGCVNLQAVSVGKNLSYIGWNAFPDGGATGFYLYYAGSAEDFSKVEIDDEVLTMFPVCMEYEHVHSFGEYVSDNNAETYCDGSKSAVCLNGCEFVDLKRDKGSKLVPLGKTSKITSTQTESTITLNWKAVDGANAYKIYFMNGTSWKQCAAPRTTTYTFKNLKPGAKYTFAVQAGRIRGTGSEWAKPYTTHVTATKSGAIAKLSATQSTSAIKLTWTASQGATGYRIFYKAGNGWKACVSSTTALTHTFRNLKPGAKYTFAVQPYVKNGSVVVWSDYAQLDTAVKATGIAKLSSSQSTSEIRLTWTASQGATGYRIFFRSGGKWKVTVSSTANTSHTFRNLKAGAKCTFAVQPYVKNGSAVVWSDYITTTAATKPATPKVTASSTLGGQAVVSWNAVNGANGYQLYYKVNNGSYKLHKEYTSAGKLTFNNLKRGATYTFAVRAFVNTSAGKVRSGYMEVGTRIAYKIDRYNKAFESGKFYMQINDPDLGVVAMAMNGNKMFVESSMDGLSLKLIFRGDKKSLTHPDGTWYMIIDSLKKYSVMPDDLIDGTDDIFEDLKNSEENIAYKTTYETIGGKHYEVESGKNPQGITYKYYFNGDTLVRSQKILADGTAETTDFKKISSSVPDSLFEIPSDYSLMDISWILSGLDD